MIKGVLAVLAASVAYGVMPVFSKTAMTQGMNAESVVFFRFLFSAVFALLFLIRRSNRRYVTHQQLRHLLIFGILGFGMTINLLTFSYQYIPTGLATMFHFAYPLVILAVMAVLYHEKITRYKVAAVAVALAGVALFHTDFWRQKPVVGPAAGTAQRDGICLPDHHFSCVYDFCFGNAHLRHSHSWGIYRFCAQYAGTGGQRSGRRSGIRRALEYSHDGRMRGHHSSFNFDRIGRTQCTACGFQAVKGEENGILFLRYNGGAGKQHPFRKYSVCEKQ